MATEPRKFTIRPYQMEDMPWVVEVASYRSLVEEANRPDLVHIPTWYQLAGRVLSGGLGVIGECNGKRVGMIGALLVPHIFNPSIISASVVTWYVLPEYRKTRISVMLLNEVERISNEVADTLVFSILEANPIKNESLERRGMKLTEMSYTKQLRG